MSRDHITLLGIETSCDETAASLVRRTVSDEKVIKGEILSNVVRSQLTEHAAYGGVVPEIAARAHVEILDDLIATAMQESDHQFTDLDAIAVTAGPGLIGGLLVGMTTAKTIALVHNLPLIAVNHLEAHALTPGLTDGVRPPYLLLLISGGHTQLLSVNDIGDYSRLGTTIDDALGEAFDKTAKLLGLPYPGGPEVEAWAARGNPTRFAFPRPLKGRDEPNFSFSGLKTALRQTAQKLAPLSDQDVSDLCASFQAAIADTIVDRTWRAMQLHTAAKRGECDRTNAQKLVVAGGVAANQHLKQSLENLAREMSFSLHVPPPALCTDNAAMIAWAGAEHLANGAPGAPLDTPVHARWPLDKNVPPAIGAGVKA